MANLKNVKKGDKVIMRLFTGAYSGVKEVEKADKDFIYFTTRKGLSKFSRKTGKIVDPAPKNDTYASYIEEYDADVEAEEIAKKENGRQGKSEKVKKEKAESKKAKKAKKQVEEEEELEDDEEEEVEEPTPAPKKKKAVAKKVIKKAAKKAVEEDDDEDFEEVE